MLPMWSIVAIFAIAIVSIGVIGTVAIYPSLRARQAPNLPVPSLRAAPSVPATLAPPATPNAMPTVVIQPSEITQLQIPPAQPNDPSQNAKYAINDPVIQLSAKTGKEYCNNQVIQPPQDGDQWGDVFQCATFGNPGTTGTANAVLAGHTTRGATTVLNRLFDQYSAGISLMGRSVLIHTATSGSHWLLYRVTSVATPLKKDFGALLETQLNTPGRLVIVTCVEHPSNTESTNNLVVIAEFVGVQ